MDHPVFSTHWGGWVGGWGVQAPSACIAFWKDIHESGGHPAYISLYPSRGPGFYHILDLKVVRGRFLLKERYFFFSFSQAGKWISKQTKRPKILRILELWGLERSWLFSGPTLLLRRWGNWGPMDDIIRDMVQTWAFGTLLVSLLPEKRGSLWGRRGG